MFPVSLDQISNRVLVTSLSPSLKEAYSQDRCEIQRQATMDTENHSEPSALIVHRNMPHSDPPSAYFGSDFCTYCNNSKHDVYWNKHDYP